jgi:hypothetical protein
LLPTELVQEVDDLHDSMEADGPTQLGVVHVEALGRFSPCDLITKVLQFAPKFRDRSFKLGRLGRRHLSTFTPSAATSASMCLAHASSASRISSR